MDFAPLVAAAALVWKLVDTVKYLRARNMDAVLIQVVTWVGGVLVALLLSATDFANGIDIGGRDLGHMNIASVILIGLSLGSSASVGVDVKKAIDNTDSAAVPLPRRVPKNGVTDGKA